MEDTLATILGIVVFVLAFGLPVYFLFHGFVVSGVLALVVNALMCRAAVMNCG